MMPSPAVQVPTDSNFKSHDYLDQENFRSLFVQSSGLDDLSLSMRFHVTGMRCARCVQKIENLSQSVSGLLSVRVSLADHTAQVKIDPILGSFSQAVHAMEQFGYQCRPLPLEEDSNDLQKIEARKDLIRLGIVGACASNIMMFSFANYFGQTGLGAAVFNWINLLLFIPVLTYGAWPFYRGFWFSMKERRLSIDAPMVVAFSVGSVSSVWSLIASKDLIYFDSLSGFIFLILLSRWVQKKMQGHFLSFMQNLTLHEGLKIQVEGHNSPRWIPARDLKIDDILNLVPGDILPTDAELLQERALFDMSFISGESLPRVFTQHMRVPGGARCLQNGSQKNEMDDLVRLRALCIPGKTEFGQLLRTIRDGVFYKVKALNSADKAAQILIGVVFTLALSFLIIYWQVDSEQAVARALALVILACPCAMAFGTPLALAFNLRKAVDRGILIKSADVFEKIHRVKHVFLDKTGTLTANRLVVSGTKPSVLNPSLARLILNLEMPSHHPVAFAIREYFTKSKIAAGTPDGASLPDSLILDHHEVTGVGVIGLVEGYKYEIKSGPSLSKEGLLGDSKVVGVYRNGVLICEIFLQEELWPAAQSVINFLKKKNLPMTLLSGDNQFFVEELGKKLGIAAADCLGGLSPFVKGQLVESKGKELLKTDPLSEVMMIGDGVNDALALQKAGVGIAVKGSVEVALKTADVYMLESGVGPLPELFSLSTNAHRLIHRNLKISLFYNCIGGLGALCGYVNPFVAAILMPISSGFILLNTWLESKK